MKSLYFLLVLAAGWVVVACSERSHAAEILLRFVTEDGDAAPKAQNVIWLNNEPIDFVSQRDSFQVEGFPALRGKNILRLTSVQKQEFAVSKFQVLLATADRPLNLVIDQNKEFIVPVGETHSPTWRKISNLENDRGVIISNIQAMLDAVHRQDKKGLMALFKGEPESIIRTFPAGVFADKKWISKSVASQQVLEICSGDFLLLVFPGRSMEACNLLTAESSEFEYKLRAVQLFYNRDNEIALYEPSLGDVGFVFKNQPIRK